MAKKRKKNKKVSARKRTTRKTASKNNKTLRLLSYMVSYEPIEDSTVPDEIGDELDSLFEKAQKTPGAIIERLEELVKQYPKVPKLYNYISVAYSHLNDQVKSKYWVEQNYLKNPDYLFAKLNYAEVCMIEGKYEKVPEILDNKFDIKLLYPGREVFHITEVVNFMGIVGSYFVLAGNKEQAEFFYRSLKDLAPGHPHTKKLKHQLLMSSLKSGMNKLMGRR